MSKFAKYKKTIILTIIAFVLAAVHIPLYYFGYFMLEGIDYLRDNTSYILVSRFYLILYAFIPPIFYFFH